MARRDEFDDEGFFESLLNRKGNTELPQGLRRIFIVISLLALVGIVIAVVASVIPSGGGEDEGAPVPIIRADNSPFKIKPEDPGGMKVPNKDSTIFETLKGEKEEKTENLLEDDGDTAASEAAREVVASKVETKTEPLTEPLSELKLDQEKETPPEDELVPPQPVAPVVKEEPKKVEAPKEKTIIDTLKEDSKPKVAAAPVKAPVAPVASGGATYIQLAAVKSEAEAASQWSKFKAKNPELSALSMRTQKADLGAKGIFYRIQAGPLSPTAATNTCTAVKSRGGSCIIAK